MPTTGGGMTITTVHDIPRDRFMRPLVKPPTGGKPVAYTRCTTFVGCLEDTYNLSRWQQRMVALGLAERPDLMLQIASTDPADKNALNDVCDKAMEHAKAHAAATIGTALHALCERIDRGQPLGVIPKEYEADIAAYIDATKQMESVHIEQFCVLDNLRIGGTPDRVVQVNGKRYIADIKTGDITYGLGKIEMQLAVYAHSKGYNHGADKPRFDLGDIDPNVGIVIHLPAGTGTCELVPVDIAAGWNAVALAHEVRQWRQTKRGPVPMPWATTDGPALADLIAIAKDPDAIRELWAQHHAIWTEELTELARARTAELADTP
jgi:hypothetical protein